MIKRTICIENPSHLKCRNNQLIVSYSGIKGMEDWPEKSVPVEDIGILILEHPQITISHYLLDKLMEYNAAVVCCNGSHHPSGLFLCLEGNTLQAERFRLQTEASEPLKKQLWQQTIKAKIFNQAKVLEKFQIPADILYQYYQEVRSGDTGNHEAKASAYYWKHLFPPVWNFYRRREGPPPNNLLNYGYALLRAAMARALIGSGLLPTLGIFHRSRYNAYALADDIMEPYRPFIDNVVREIVHNTSHISELNRELKTTLLKALTCDVQIDKETSPLFVAVQRTSASLAKCFLGESRKILYPSFSP